MPVSLTVEFDRADRTYRVSEPVKGRVLVETDRGADCSGVTLIPTWRAQGFGNTDWKLDPEVYTIHDGALPEGPSHEIPFSFPAPRDCVSYRGKQFDVEHYVQVEIDLSGSRLSLQEAADASKTVEYTVLPGPLMRPPPRHLLQATAFAIASRNSNWTASATHSAGVSNQDLQALFTTLETMGDLRRWVAERRIGPVLAHLNCRVVCPGEALRVNLRLKPPFSVMINGASIQIRAQEISTSRYRDVGSPHIEKRKTSERTLYSVKRPITRDVSLGPLESSVFRAEVEIPDTDAFTFVSAHHKLVWEAVVRIDIPTWPDWEKAFPLILWPEVREGTPEEDLEPMRAEIPETVPEGVWDASARKAPEEVWKRISELAAGSEGEAEEPTSEKWLSWNEAREFAAQEGILGGEGRGPVAEDGAAELAEEIRDLWEGEEAGVPLEDGAGAPQVDPAPEPELVPETGPAPGSGWALEAAVEAIRAEKIIGGDRDRLISDLKGQKYSFELTLKRADRTLGMFSEPDYKDGRTLVGAVVGTGIEVSVLYPNAMNEEVDSFEIGATLPVWGVVSEWDGLRKQPRLRVEKG